MTISAPVDVLFFQKLFESGLSGTTMSSPDIRASVALLGARISRRP